MTGETAIGGVYVPTLLLLAVAALILSAGLKRLLTLTPFYRFVAYRAAVDLSLFVLVFGLLAILVPLLGIRL